MSKKSRYPGIEILTDGRKRIRLRAVDPRTGRMKEVDRIVEGTIEEAVRLRADKFFLMDALYCDDLQVRQWAVKELNAVLAMPVTFDVGAPLEQRKAAIAKLRDSVVGVNPPSTRPGPPPPAPPASRATTRLSGTISE